MWTKKFTEIEVVDKGSSLVLSYGSVSTPFGNCFICFAEKNKVCHLHFLDKKSASSEVQRLQSRWPNAAIHENTKAAQTLADEIFVKQPKGTMYIILQGTEFQAKVWSSLLDIPVGQTTSYADVAISIGNPKAIRAVAHAVGSNEIAYLIPCHRVTSKSGVSKCRWGSEVKKQIMSFEKSVLKA